jgi:transposase
MVTDKQVRELMKYINSEVTFKTAAIKAGMDEKTARKYRKLGALPSQIEIDRHWRTRKDPFGGVWSWVTDQLTVNPGLEAKTLFEALQREYPGEYPDGQLRTLQRKIKQWRALEGPSKEVYFSQKHHPGNLCQSDFTTMSRLGITISGQPFDHLVFHFVLTYSNWETGTICASESFESLSEGLQNALWKLGGLPKSHQTDRLSAAVHKECHPEKFTQRYKALLAHYGIEGRRIQARKPNENGDVEQSHHRFKRAVEQALFLRGHRNFKDQDAYRVFLEGIFCQKNRNREKKFQEEVKVLKRLPARRMEDFQVFTVKVTSHSTIRIHRNTYSVASRLIGEKVQVKLFSDHLEINYGQRRLETIPRVKGRNQSRIEYRHIIDWLVRKPGAFENYKYHEDLFPSSRFKMAYDYLKRVTPQRANKIYLKILNLAAKESETSVNQALQIIFSQELPLDVETVKSLISNENTTSQIIAVEIAPVNLMAYDELLNQEVSYVG